MMSLLESRTTGSLSNLKAPGQLKKERLGILVTVKSLSLIHPRMLKLADQLLGRTCGIEDAPLNPRLEHQLPRPAGVASEGGDPRGNEGFAGGGGGG